MLIRQKIDHEQEHDCEESKHIYAS